MSTKKLSELGSHLASRGRAADLRREVLAVLEREQPYVLDFEGVLGVSDSFGDELIAVLAAEKGDAWFRQNIRIVGASEVVRSSLIRAIGTRLARANGQQRGHGPQGYELAPPPRSVA